MCSVCSNVVLLNIHSGTEFQFRHLGFSSQWLGFSWGKKDFPSPLPRREGMDGNHLAAPSNKPLVTPPPGRGTNVTGQSMTWDHLSHWQCLQCHKQQGMWQRLSSLSTSPSSLPCLGCHHMPRWGRGWEAVTSDQHSGSRLSSVQWEQ